ncbi:MAG: hypothetical protein ACI841_001644 [Planctomycetota bacterium]|jgi:hypothetical protein
MNRPTPTRAFDATLTSRYKCKYLITRRTAESLRTYLTSHAGLAPYSVASEGESNRALSLYRDNPGLDLYRDTLQGVRNRYELRLRYYAEEGNGSVFMEVKKCANIIVCKNRALVTRAEAEQFLQTGGLAIDASRSDDLHESFGC